MANVPISNFVVPTNTVGIGATGYSLTGSASASFMDLAGTWNTSGTPTAVKVNITDTASNAASLLMDLQVGGASAFNVTKLGHAVATQNNSGPVYRTSASSNSGLGTISGDPSIWSSGVLMMRFSGGAQISIREALAIGATGGGGDVFLSRRAAANLRLGAADAAAPVAQTLSVQSVVAGTSNTAGANLTITGSQGTGSGAGGSIIFQVAPANGGGGATVQNPLVAALTIKTDRIVGPAGSVVAGNGPGITFNGFETTGIAANANNFGFWVSGILGFNLTDRSAGGGQFRVAADYAFSWSSATNNNAVSDLYIVRDAANTLALRNGTAGQTFNTYGTFTDASNYRRVVLTMSNSGVASLKTEGAGTGASGNVIHISGLPTSNPGPGILWNNAGTPAIGT